MKIYHAHKWVALVSQRCEFSPNYVINSVQFGLKIRRGFSFLFSFLFGAWESDPKIHVEEQWGKIIQVELEFALPDINIHN